MLVVCFLFQELYTHVYVTDLHPPSHCHSLTPSQAVELENGTPRKVTKYIIIISTLGYQDTEETVVLGTEQDGSRWEGLSQPHTPSHSLTHTHTHTHPHIVSHSHTHTHTFTHTHSLTHTHTHTHTHTPSHCLSPSHTHTLTHTLTLSLSLTHTHTLTLSLSLTHTHTHSHTHTLPLSSSSHGYPLLLGSVCVGKLLLGSCPHPFLVSLGHVTVYSTSHYA